MAMTMAMTHPWAARWVVLMTWLLLYASWPAAGQEPVNWPDVAVQYVGHPRGAVCTATVINAELKIAITTAHCVVPGGTGLLVAGGKVEEQAVIVLDWDGEHDLAILQLPVRPKGQIALAPQGARVGESLMVMGYSYSEPVLLYRWGRMAAPVGVRYPFAYVDIQAGSGFSGGPLVNADGELAAIFHGWATNQDQIARVSVYGILKHFGREYWPE